MICNKCNNQYQSTFKFCPHCGHSTGSSMVETEQSCPKCLKDDSIQSVWSLVSSQMSGETTEEFRATKLASSLMNGVGSKPQGFLQDVVNLFDDTKIKRWDKATSRFKNSYYCSRCSLVFYTEAGIKKHSNVEQFYSILYEGLS